MVAWRRNLVSALRNVSLLERPVQPITLTSAVQSALRARGRQYEIRALIQAREQAAQQLALLPPFAAMSCAADERELAHRPAARKRRCDDTAKRKPAKIDFRRRADQTIDRFERGRKECFEIGALRQRIRIAVAGQIGHPYRAYRGERFDIAHPMRPAAVSAVHEHQWLAAAECAPHHAHTGSEAIAMMRRARIEPRGNAPHRARHSGRAA